MDPAPQLPSPREDAFVMRLLGAHLPLTLLLDLALGDALRSEDVLRREGSGRSALVA